MKFFLKQGVIMFISGAVTSIAMRTFGPEKLLGFVLVMAPLVAVFILWRMRKINKA